MITGFNTDIEYQGVTYHVQTEDKGVKTPLILSLVYNRGTILASKRSPYDDLLLGKFDENQLAERLHKQHKLICAAIRAGRLEDLKQMTAKAAAEKQNSSAIKSQTESGAEKAAQSAAPAVQEVVQEISPVAENRQIVETKLSGEFQEIPKKNQEVPKKDVEAVSDGSVAQSKIEIVRAKHDEEKVTAATEENVWEAPFSVSDDSVIFDDVQIIEDETVMSAEAVQIIEDAPTNEAVDNQLKIEMLDNIVFKSGERKALALIVKRGNAENGLEGAHIMVKVTGTSFRPLIFHAKTDVNGTAVVHLQLPHFRAGRAAVLIKAMSGGEEVEVRRSIQHD